MLSRRCFPEVPFRNWFHILVSKIDNYLHLLFLFVQYLLIQLENCSYYNMSNEKDRYEIKMKRCNIKEQQKTKTI